MIMNDLLIWMQNRLPLAVAGGEIALADVDPPAWVVDEDWMYVGLRTITIEDGTIVDVREQHVVLGRYGEYPAARWQAYIEGTLRAAAAIVESFGGLDAMLPCDLFAHRRVLDDPTLPDADAIAAALSDPEQLARWNAELDDEAWCELLEPCGLADRLAEVKALRRPSLRLYLSEHENDVPAIGLSRLGGDPDLPPSQPWPEIDGEPLVFVAQLDLADLAEHPEARELPREGLLSFFYAPFAPEGHNMEHPVAVLHLRELDQLEPRPAPSGCKRLRSYAIDVEGEVHLPAIESYFHFEALQPVPAPIDYNALAELIMSRSECDFDRPTHRLLGHPSSIQGDPYLDIEMARRGWEGWREGSEEALASKQRALGWRLLLQIDAYQDDELLLNQDGGFFYFFIPATALAVHDWSRARGCLQCH